MLRTTTLLAALTTATLGFTPGAAKAQDFWIGQIVLGGWNFCPRTTIPASGQLLPISSNQALFSLYGCTFGGDCRTTFAMPDLRGRYATSVGAQPGLSNIAWGEKGGRETETLNVQNMPSHTHAITSNATSAVAANPGAATSGATGKGLAGSADTYSGTGNPSQAMADNVVSTTVTSTAQNTGGSQAFNIKDPFLGLQYCVVTNGIFPSRN